MYQPYLFIYRMNDLKPEIEIQKYDWTTRLSSRRVEDGKGVNLNTILIKLKCENTQHKMDCIELAHPTQLCYSVFLSALICRIYKWNIQTLFALFLLFLLGHTESLCSLIFLYILISLTKTIATNIKVTMENWKNHLLPISGRTVLHTSCFM